jgi:hypothetical protein
LEPLYVLVARRRARLRWYLAFLWLQGAEHDLAAPALLFREVDQGPQWSRHLAIDGRRRGCRERLPAFSLGASVLDRPRVAELTTCGGAVGLVDGVDGRLSTNQGNDTVDAGALGVGAGLRLLVVVSCCL